jgi:hypothetical protein
MVALRWSDELLEQARQIHERVRRRLLDLEVPGTLLLTGGTSVAGALTKGDVDLHLRVPPPEFERAVERLVTVLEPAERQIWQPTLAVFAVAEELPTGLAATPLGPEHDRRFTLAWQRIAEDAAALAEYNRIKREHHGTPRYEPEKSDFFGRLAP